MEISEDPDAPVGLGNEPAVTLTTMKMKLLDCALIALLAGIAANAGAQERVDAADTDARNTDADNKGADNKGADRQARVDCGATGCASTSGDGVLLRVRTRGARKPATVGTGEASASAALQPDRRVTVQAELPGMARAVGRWSVDLPTGGVLWATEDPNLGQPQLSISGVSYVPFDGTRITRPVNFYARSNYPAFIQSAEVLVFAATDADLVHPLARVPMDVGAISNVSWDGAVSSPVELRAGDELLYLLRVTGTDGSVDETFPRRLQLVKPEEADNAARLLRNRVENRHAGSFSLADAERLSQMDAVFGENALRQQNSAIHGSRIRITGRDIPERMSVSINGQSYPVDLERKLVAEFLMPVGRHVFDIEASGEGETIRRHWTWTCPAATCSPWRWPT